MRRIIALLLALAMPVLAFAAKEKLVVGTNFGFTGATGIDTTIFKFYFNGSTTALTVDTIITGWPGENAFLSDTLLTDSLGSWLIQIITIDSNGNEWGEVIREKTYVPEYSRWGGRFETQNIMDGTPNLLRNASFDDDSVLNSNPEGWVIAKTSATDTVDSRRGSDFGFNSKYVLYAHRASASTQDTVKITQTLQVIGTAGIYQWGAWFNTSGLGSNSIQVNLLAGGTLVDSAIFLGNTSGPYFLGGVTPLSSTSNIALQIMLWTDITTLGAVVDGGFISAIHYDTVMFVSTTDSTRIIGQLPDTLTVTIDSQAIVDGVVAVLIDSADFFKADISAIQGGTGTNLAQTYLLSSTDSSTIYRGVVDFKNTSDSSTSISFNFTDINGLASNNVDDGSYYQMASASQFTFTNKTTSFSGSGIVDTMFGVPFDPGAPTQPGFVRLIIDMGAGFAANTGLMVNPRNIEATFNLQGVDGPVIIGDFILFPSDTSIIVDTTGRIKVDLGANNAMTPSTTRWTVTFKDLSNFGVPLLTRTFVLDSAVVTQRFEDLDFDE